MDADQRGRYIRWQGQLNTQLFFSINLFLGFAIASLAFVINIKLESKPTAGIQVQSVLAWWASSAVVGCVATISKLLDYRYTARKIKDGGTLNTAMAKYCGPVTWGCFWTQVTTYAIGACGFVTGVAKL